MEVVEKNIEHLKNKKNMFYITLEHHGVDTVNNLILYGINYVKSHKNNKKISFKKTLINENNKHLVHMYDITSYPSIVLVKNNGQQIHYNLIIENPKLLDYF